MITEDFIKKAVLNETIIESIDYHIKQRLNYVDNNIDKIIDEKLIKKLKEKFKKHIDSPKIKQQVTKEFNEKLKIYVNEGFIIESIKTIIHDYARDNLQKSIQEEIKKYMDDNILEKLSELRIQFLEELRDDLRLKKQND